jgi:putative ABC transport system permease protein
MNRLRVFFSQIAGLFGKSRSERQLEEEMSAHVDLLIAENIRHGMSLEEARHAARREFGGIEQTKELYRDQRGLPFFEVLAQDLRFAFRSLRKSPGFTAVAVLTLALGIGANTAIFSVVYGILLRPLPNPHPERIVQLTETAKGETYDRSITHRQLLFFQEHKEAFSYLAAFTPVGFNLAWKDDVQRINALHVSSDYFHVLGVAPVLGRDFRAEEDRGTGTRVAILSYGLWRRQMAGDANIVGRVITLDGEPFDVIGVMPPDFERVNTPFTHGGTDVWVPMSLIASTVGSGENLALIGRLRDDVSLNQARAGIGIVSQEFRKTFPNELDPQSQLDLSSYQEFLTSDLRTILFAMFGAVGFVLLIAAANVANLLLGRAASRGREIAVRTALGATRTRLFAQMITESILLSLLGAAAGLLLAEFGLRAMLALSPPDLPRAGDVHLDGWAFGFAFAVALLTGIVFGLAPAIRSSRKDVTEGLKEGMGRVSEGKGRMRLRAVLAICEIGLSLVLLTGAALMIKTFKHVVETDPGFDPSHIVSMQIWLSGSKYKSTPEVSNFYDEVLGRIRNIPGVQSAAVVAAGIPLERGGNMPVLVAGKEGMSSAGFRMITPDYFAAMKIPLKIGRAFASTDNEKSNPVAVVSESFARSTWPNQNPIGQHLQVGQQDSVREVVGVVGDVKSYLDQPAEPTVFLPMAQSAFDAIKVFEGWFATAIVARTSVEPLTVGKSLAEQLHAVNPSIASGHVRTMEQVRSVSVSLRQFNMTLLTVFASLAVLLAAVGVYGVLAYNVAQRSREIGVRMALGASPCKILSSVLAEGSVLSGVGIVLGVAGAFALTRVLESYLYEVTATDPSSFVTTAIFLAVVALAACCIPARRAMRVDPMVALRNE